MKMPRQQNLSEAASDPFMRRLLEHIKTNGPLSIGDGEAWPVDRDIVNRARKIGLIRVDEGNFWEPTLTIHLSRRGLRSLGFTVPLSVMERIWILLSKRGLIDYSGTSN